MILPIEGLGILQMQEIMLKDNISITEGLIKVLSHLIFLTLLYLLRETLRHFGIFLKSVQNFAIEH